jgi:lysosomal Pro-X carboxypeptidase
MLGGGISTNLSDSLIAYMIKNAAHHLDLLTPNDEDIESVIIARTIETNFLKKWVK